MPKKKTSVVLPGGIQGLVHNLQNGNAMKEESEERAARQQGSDEVNETKPEPAQEQPRQPEPEPAQEHDEARQGGAEAPRQEESQPTAQSQTAESQHVAAQDTQEGESIEQKEYHVIKDDTNDSWQLFLDMAEQYKKGDGKLATIYIDPALKQVLDRLKYAGNVKLSTSAILSSIVARFIYDHEEKIKEILFGGKLL